MKKIGIIIGIVILGTAAWAGYFYYKNLRGIGPAVNPPIADIVGQISGEDRSGVSGPALNKTDFPLKLPDGFTISIFAKDVSGARVLTWDPAGKLLVSLASQGKVVALPDTDGDGVSDSPHVVASGLNKPHGLAFHNGKLYIAETDQVAVYDYDAVTVEATSKKKLVDLPVGGNHFSRTIAFGPDGRLYISIGSSCNVCVESDWRRAKILVANADGSDLKVFASGLRNAVFFTWSPLDSRMWATNMGRDLIGDDIPPETVNIVSAGKDFGWPYCWGQRVWDRTFDSTQKAENFCKTVEPPHIEYQAHAAPLGLAFIPQSWGREYAGDLLVAFHGSWNRSQPVGYKIVRFKLDERGNYLDAEDFISGWFPSGGGSGGALGRPVDLIFDSKGNVFVSDDKAGVIYRVAPSLP